MPSGTQAYSVLASSSLITDFVSILQLSHLSAQAWVLLLIIALACIATIWVARGYGGADGRMLRSWVVYQAILPLTAVLLLALAYEGGKLGGWLTLFLIAGILVGFAVFKNRNSLRSRR